MSTPQLKVHMYSYAGLIYFTTKPKEYQRQQQQQRAYMHFQRDASDTCKHEKDRHTHCINFRLSTPAHVHPCQVTQTIHVHV